jgi:signal transduction histidine kinase
MKNQGQPGAHQERLRLRTSALLLVAALIAYVWISISTERHSLRLEVHEQGKHLALSLESAIDVVRKHIFTARRTVEHALIRPDMAQQQGKELILAESGALHIDPRAELKPELHRRNLAAASTLLPGVAASHQWNPVFQWTYYYDAKARWFLIYPYLSQEDLLRTTKTGELSAALKVFFDADGTRPLELIGPHKNSGRDMRWTPPYEDSAGKGRMVSLLAPVYLADELLGAIGTDVTLKQLDTVLHRHVPDIGRSLVVNDQGIVLADSGGSTQASKQLLKATDVFPQLANLPAEGDPAWQRLPLRGTTWTLWVHATDSDLNRAVINNLIPSFVIAALLFIALLGLLWVQQRRSKDLTEAVDTLEETRTALVRADRLGAMGGLIASVSREIDTPLQQSAQTVGALLTSLTVFREQQQRGLRRSELDDFVTCIDQSGEQLARQINDANDLLQRFRQLAVDQSSEQARQFRLRDIADNVVAVLRPALKRRDCHVDNAIATDLTVTADAGTMGQILHYLLNDALERSRAGQTLQLTAGWNTSQAGEVIDLTLTDTAATPPDANAEHLALATRLARQDLGGELAIDAAADSNRLILRVPVRS